MPFYEYIAVALQKSCEHCVECLEIRQSILDESLKECPHCGSPIQKKISLNGAFVTTGRQMNSYNDVKAAKYWRDKNGIRHRVTSADGSRSSPTVSRKVTASPEQIKNRKQKDKEKTSRRLKRIKHGLMRKT